MLKSILPLALFFSAGLLTAAETTLKIGAAIAPHSEILEFVRPALKKQGIVLDIKVLDDEGQLNPALAEKQIDANFFQHEPYLQTVAQERGYQFSVLAKVHVEPIGFYSQSIKSKTEFKPGSRIGIPNNPSNEYRALALLEQQGLIKLKKGINPNQSSPRDIAENPLQLKIVEIDAAQLPRSLTDLAGAVINTNIVLESKLDPASAVFRENATSPYANLVVIRKGEENRQEFVALKKALQSPELKAFILKKYGQAVIPAF
ncbi:MAG TPA: MetQ/NlpA family ABC transporter substrate-binding protein [Oligoflexus sp.]|uniref:MetQ/NlpA family ABC transporter substrate-binding protein n=1 Tax=Oligoflexus sp. TaxID=1971216 RepID=UPI002D70A7B1|nr:MetQ/NlpA family ABC transporter substrate-binding protein [Oligoflexus sp.]HYX37516.1 MetQ/NlpA family ABC transporter substrate-binding protein [Oligoflexus sp.]